MKKRIKKEIVGKDHPEVTEIKNIYLELDSPVIFTGSI